MTKNNYQTALELLRSHTPFRVFTVELSGGKRLEVDHAEALMPFHDLTYFVAPGGIVVFFDHESVLRIYNSGALADV